MIVFLPNKSVSGTFFYNPFPSESSLSIRLSKSFLICLLLLVFNVESANSALRTASVTGDWNSTATWGGFSVPAANDDVVINTGITVTVNANTNSLASLIINSGGKITTSGTFTLSATTITVNGYYKNGSSGAITGTMTVESGGTYEHAQNGGSIPTATWNILSTCLITGVTTTSPSNYNQTFGNFTWNCVGHIGYLRLEPVTSLLILGNLTIINTGSGGGTSPYDLAIHTGNFTVGKDLIITGGVYRICYNISSTLTIKKNVSITGGQLLMNSSDAGTNMTGTLNVAGNFTITGGTINSRSGSTSPINNIVFNGSGVPQLYTSGGSITSSANNNTINFTVASPAFLQMTSGGSPGIISANTSTNPANTTFTLSSGATLGITSNVGIVSSGSTGNIQTNTRTFDPGANYTYNGSTNQNAGTGFPTNLTGKLTIDDSGYTVTLDNARTIANGGSINLVAGSFANGSNLTMATTSTINRSEGSMSVSPGSGVYNVNYSGNTKSTGIELAGAGLNNVAVSLTSGQVLSLDQSRIPDGNLTINTGSTFDLKTFNLNRSVTGGTLTVAGTLLLGGTSGGQTGSNFPLNYSTMTMSGGTVNYNNAGSTQIIYAVPSFYNNLTITNPAGVTLNANTTVSGTFLETTNSKITIAPGLCLTANTITNTNSNQIYIRASTTSGANGTLIFHNAGNVYGSVEMNSIASWNLSNTAVGSKYKWQFFGIPLKSLITTSPFFDGTYVRQMHEDDSPYHWDQLNNSSSMSSFTGYEITQPKANTYVFQGQLENADYTKTLPFTSGKSYPGQSLIGNPYTAAINISLIGFTGNVLKTVYIYNTGSMSDWTGQLTTDSIDSTTRAGQYTAIPQAQAGQGTLPGQIPSMQAFLVKASSTGSTVSIPYSTAGVMVPNSVPQRTKGNLIKSASDKIFTIIDVKGSRFSDRMWIFTESGCSHSFDNGWDGEKLLGSGLAPQLYAMEADGDYQVNSVDDINNSYLGFQGGEDSLYTLTFTHQNTGLKYGSIYLTDSVSQQTADITPGGSIYTFLSLPTDSIIKRFKIITTPPDISTNVTTPVAKSSQLKIFSSKHSVYIDNKSDENGFLYLYDMTGRFIQKYAFTANGVTTLQPNVTPGTYLAKGITKKRTETKNIPL